MENRGKVNLHISIEDSKLPMDQISGLYYYPAAIPSDLANRLEVEFSDTNPHWTPITGSDHSRRVIHFGSVYDYQKQNKNELLAHPFSSNIVELLSVVYQHHPHLRGKLTQGIANRYLPGEGITAHIDDKKFDDFICCFSIGSDTTMEFSRPEHDPVPVRIERNSLYVMSGEARWLWKHSMAGRKTDQTDQGRIARDRRVSLTFRVLKH